MDTVDFKSRRNGDFVTYYMVLWKKNGTMAINTNYDGVYINAQPNVFN